MGHSELHCRRYGMAKYGKDEWKMIKQGRGHWELRWQNKRLEGYVTGYDGKRTEQKTKIFLKSKAAFISIY